MCVCVCTYVHLYIYASIHCTFGIIWRYRIGIYGATTANHTSAFPEPRCSQSPSNVSAAISAVVSAGSEARTSGSYALVNQRS